MGRAKNKRQILKLSPAQRLASSWWEAQTEQLDQANAVIQISWLLLERLKTAVGAVDESERQTAQTALGGKGDTLAKTIAATDKFLARGHAMKRQALGMEKFAGSVAQPGHDRDPDAFKKLYKDMEREDALAVRELVLAFDRNRVARDRKAARL
jgi:hypothetical protein